MRILVIEDDEFDSENLKRMLSRGTARNYDTEVCPTLRHALIAARDGFDLALLDLGLPDASGLSGLDSMQQFDRPVVILTGMQDQALSDRALGRGAQDYLQKDTLTSERLESAIRYALQRHALAARLHTLHQRESILRALIAELSGAARPAEVISRTLKRLPALAEVTSAAYYLPMPNSGFRALHTDDRQGTADQATRDALQLVLQERDPVEPGVGPPALRNAWLVPIYDGESQFGVLAVKAGGDASRKDTLGLLNAVGQVLAASLSRARLYLNERRAVLAAQKIAAYVPRELVDRISANPDMPLAPIGRRSNAVVVFADLCGFTGFSQHLSPPAIVTHLNAFFQELDDIVIRHGGVIDKHIGDAAMVVFHDLGDLASQEAAVRAAAGALSDMLQRFGEGEWVLHAGAALGQVVIGNVGSAYRCEYTVIGDAVNVASRLADLAPPGRLLVEGNLHKEFSALGLLSKSGPLRLTGTTTTELRGRVGEVSLHELLPS